ncbi:MAG: hypothetical protein AAB337_02175 [Patescibacteria group bacterium]
MATGDGRNEAGQAAVEALLKAEEQQQEAERQAQVDAVVAEAVAADGWSGDFKKNRKKKAEHLQAYIDAIKAGPKDPNIAKGIFRGSLKAPVFKNLAMVERFNAFMNKIDAIYGVSKKVAPEAPPAPATPELVPVAPEPAKATAPSAEIAPDKGESAEAEFRKLQNTFSAEVKGYEKQDKAFRAAPDARSATENWLRAKRSGIDVQTHPFFDRMIGDKEAFAAFADGIDDLDKRRIKAKNDTGGNWRENFGKGPRANDLFERTVDDELVATRVRLIENFAREEAQALGEQAVFAKLDADGRKAKLKPIVELLAKEQRAATDEEANSLVGETGPVKEIQGLLWELAHIETERQRVKKAFDEVRNKGKKKETAALTDAETAAKEAAKGADLRSEIMSDIRQQIADASKEEQLDALRGVVNTAVAPGKLKQADMAMFAVAIDQRRLILKAAQDAQAAVEESTADATTTSTVESEPILGHLPGPAGDTLADKKAWKAAEYAQATTMSPDGAAAVAEILAKGTTTVINRNALSALFDEPAPQIVEPAPVEAAPAVVEAEPVAMSLGEVADNEAFWHKTWFNNSPPNIRRDVVDRAMLDIKFGKDPDEIVSGLSSVKKTKDQLKVALIKLAALEPDVAPALPDAVPDMPPPLSMPTAFDSAPTNPGLLKTPEQMRTEIEADIANATTAADTEAYFNKIEGSEMRGVSGDELAAVEQAAMEKWTELSKADLSARFYDPLDAAKTPDQARAVSAVIDELQKTWDFNKESFVEARTAHVNERVAELERKAKFPPAGIAPSVAPPEAVPSTPEVISAEEVRVRELIDQATSRTDLHDAHAIIDSHYDDGTFTMRKADELDRLIRAKWDAVATPKEKAQDQLSELNDEIAELAWNLRYKFVSSVANEKVDDLITQLADGKIDVAKLKANGVLKDSVNVDDLTVSVENYKKAWEAKEAAQADFEAAEKSERPGFFARVFGRKSKPEAASTAPSAPVVDSSPFSPDKIKAKDLMSSDFWKYLGDQAVVRSKAYAKGELTESERKGEKQAWGWTVARLGLETAGSVFGAKVVTDQMRYSHTHKEYDRLLAAMGSAEASEKDPSGADFAASSAVIDEDRIKKALEASNHFSDAKKAELQPRLVAALEKVRTIARFHKDEVEKVKVERDRQIALLLDEALQLRVKQLSRNREALNTAIALATLGSSHLAGGAYNLGLRGVRVGAMALSGNVERMIRLQSERVQGGNLAELSKTQFAKDAALSVGRGLKETLQQLFFSKSEGWKAKGLDFAIGMAVVAKNVGIGMAYAADVPHVDQIEPAVNAMEDQAPPEAPHNSILFDDQGGASAPEPSIDLLHPGLAGATDLAEAPAVDQSPASGIAMTPEEYRFAYEKHMDMGPDGSSVIAGAGNLEKWATVEKGDGFISLFSRAIQNEASEEGLNMSSAEARKMAATLVQEKGLMHTWLSKGSEGNLAVDVEFKDGVVSDVHFVDATTGQEIATEDLDNRGFTMPAQTTEVVQSDGEPIEKATETGTSPGDVPEAEPVAVRPEAPTVTLSDVDSFAVPGEDGTPFEEAPVQAPAEAPAGSVSEGTLPNQEGLGAPEARGEAVSIRIPGHGMLNVPEGTYSAQDTERLVAEVKMRGDMQKVYQEILTQSKSELRFAGPENHKLETRFIKMLERDVKADGRNLDELMKDVREGRAEVTDLTPKIEENSSNAVIQRVFKNVEDRFKNRPLTTEQWGQIKEAVVRKWK